MRHDPTEISRIDRDRFERTDPQLTDPTVPANVVLEGAYERIVVEDAYGDIPLGLYVIRGENIVIMGEVVRLGRSRKPFA